MRSKVKIIISGVIAELLLIYPAGWAKTKRNDHVPSNTTREYHFKKKVDAGALQAQLRAAGFAVDYIDCSQDNCTIHMPATEKKDPAPIVNSYIYVDPMLARRQNLDAIKALTAKMDAGAISNAEKDELIRRLARQITGF